MNSITIYIIKVSLITALLYAFYRIFLSKNSNHSLNRFLLLFIILFSLICPVITFDGLFEKQLNNRLWIDDLHEFSNSETGIPVSENSKFSFYSFLMYLYISGIFLSFLLFLRQLYRIFVLNRSSDKHFDGNFTFVYTNRYNAPFSIFNHIYLPENYKNLNGNEMIIEHEKVHAKQLHSLDLFVSEFYCIFFWFNPFAFLLKKSLKTVHEYLADDKVIKKRVSVKEYLEILVSSTERSCLSGISNYFNSLTIKKRINMITRNKTSKISKYIYLLIIPLLGLMIQSFAHRNLVNNVPSLQPVKDGKVVVKFGFEGMNPITKKNFVHGGVDIKANLGTPILATAAGEVTDVSEREGWGKLIVIRHDETFETWYAHLNDFNVKTGDKVVAGQKIGTVGSTGNSTGPHLHYEVKKNGVRVDPEDYFN